MIPKQHITIIETNSYIVLRNTYKAPIIITRYYLEYTKTVKNNQTCFYSFLKVNLSQINNWNDKLVSQTQSKLYKMQWCKTSTVGIVEYAARLRTRAVLHSPRQASRALACDSLLARESTKFRIYHYVCTRFATNNDDKKRLRSYSVVQLQSTTVIG